MLLLVHTLIVKCVCPELNWFVPLPCLVIHTSSFKYQVPTLIICVDKSDDGTRKDVLFEVLLSVLLRYAV